MTDTPDKDEGSASGSGLGGFLAEYLKINAIKRIFTLVDVRRHETVYLILLAAGIALLEGIGLSLLLPVLQFAESGPSALQQGGRYFRLLQQFCSRFGLPLNLLTLLVFAFIPIVLRQFVFYWNAWYSAVVANRIATRMRVSAFDALMDADPAFFSQRSVGDLAGIVLNQTIVAGQTVLQVIRLFAIAMLLALYVAILVAVSLPLTLVTVAFAGLVSLLVRTSLVRTKRYGEQVAGVTQRAYGAVIERIGLVRLVKMRAEEATETANVLTYSEDMAQANVKIATLAAQVEVTADPLLMLSAFVTLFAGISVFGLKLAELGMLLFVLTRLNAKVKEFNAARQVISSGVASVSLVRGLISDSDQANTIRSGALRFEGLGRAITFEDVTFMYPGQEKSALRGVNVEIEAGSFTALVGRSGSGKSTLVELIPRFRDTTSGRVLFGGVDVRDFDLSELRRSIGYLTQDPLLFSDSICQNLIYGLGRVPSDAEITSALEGAHAQFVLDFPKGLETEIGDRGLRVSGGERQRIALARVLLQDPSILILDEPTSALDSESEQHIQAALAKLHGTRTIIVIAHRLATVVAADQLFVVANGRIVERGVHNELCHAGGAYQRIFESQLLQT